MTRGTLIEKAPVECPICGQVHEIETRHRKETIVIKGDLVEYDLKFLFCRNADEEECEFADGKLINENLLNARNAYRVKHNLLTSFEIIEIRKKYGLSQVELARLLGWGEATISRYESSSIQDDSYDMILRLIRDNSFEALQFLESNKNKFSSVRYFEIRKRIIECLDSTGKEHLSRQNLMGEYASFDEKSDANGYTLLDIDKLEATINYLASHIIDLFKVKLMKLLWYSDSLSFIETGHTITGLVYSHEKMGALPLGHYKIVALNNVLSCEEVIETYEEPVIHFLPNANVDMKCLSDKEKKMLDTVIARFGHYSGRQMKEYMHREVAYNKTKDGEIIPFSLAKQIKSF